MFEEATLQCAKGCAGLDDASVDIRPTGELFVNQAAEVDELGAERNKPVPVYGEVAPVAAVGGFARWWVVDGLCLGRDVAATHVHVQPKAPEVGEDVVGARNHVVACLEEQAAVVREQRRPDLELGYTTPE